MNGDDDGFCEHFSIMRMTDSKPDDLKLLQAKGFVHVFNDRVLVIMDWKENNYLRSDRYTPSKYLAIYKHELKLLIESGIPVVDQMDTQERKGKDRIGKKREEDKNRPSVSFKYHLSENVTLSLPEYRKLFKKHGKETVRAFIEKLSAYKLSKGKTYKSDYGAILTWVVDSINGKQQPKQESYTGKTFGHTSKF